MASGVVHVQIGVSRLKQSDDPAGGWIDLPEGEVPSRRYVGLFVSPLLDGEVLDPDAEPNITFDLYYGDPPIIHDLPRRTIPEAGSPAATNRLPSIDLRDGLATSGVALIFTGLAMYSWSLALSVLGVLLLAGGLWSHNAVTAQPPVPERPDGAE